MRAVIPLFCAYLNLFCPCPPASNAVSPQPSWLDHIAAPPSASSFAPFNSKATASTPKADEVVITFGDKEIPLSPSSPELDKRSVHHFTSKPACKDSAPNQKGSLRNRISQKFQKTPSQRDCIPQPMLALKAERNAELNRREEYDRAQPANEVVQAPIKLAMIAEEVEVVKEIEMGRRRRWDEYFARKKDELLEMFGRAWAEYLM